jgi:multicomponent Na+:H+ antiporter subunit D
LPLGGLVNVKALFLFAFGIKAAAFPANAWLPASYHTPAISVSALFGGLLTKVGAYAIIRALMVILPEGRDWLEPVIAVVALGTMLLGPLGALAQTNIRRATGFLVIGGIGVLFAGLTLGSLHGIGGAVFYAIHSILTLTALYLAAGLVEKMSGTQDIRLMGGIYAANSPLSIVFIVLVFAVAGLPPFLGFWPKVLLVEGGVRAGDWFIVAGLLLNSFLTLIAASRIWGHVFWRNGQEGERSEQPNAMLRPLTTVENTYALSATIVLVTLIVILGFFPNWLFAASGMAGFDMIDPARYIDAVFAEVPQP